jgi:quercetin dioxygenase-like cupin family protein
MKYKPKGYVKPQRVERAFDTEIEWLVDRNDGATNFEMRKFIIKPHGSIPKHYHPDIEHEQYVIKGRYTVGIDGETFVVGEGDSIFIPAGSVHWYENNGQTDAEFLCIIPKREDYKTVYLAQDENHN